MSQFKSKTELALTYWTLQKRWEAEGNEGYLPWKYNGVLFKEYPLFDRVLDNYELPVSILEGKPVWLGDVAFSKKKGKRIAKVNGWFDDKEMLQVCFGFEKDNAYTWTAPAPVETPTKTCGCYDKMGYDCLSMSGNEKKTDYTYTWDSPTLVKGDLGYLKQVRNQVREECMSSIAGVITRWQAKGYIIESSAGIMNDECIKAIRATKEE